MTTSVAMALYNGSKYIKKQLDSIKDQSVKLDEVVIVDDCSTDDSFEIVENYIRDNSLLNTWKVIKNEENLGFIKTFRKAIALTNNELIFLCDQDDLWMSNKVKRYLEIMSNDESIQLLASTFDGMDEDGKYIDVRTPIFTENHGLILMQHYGRNSLKKIIFKTIAERNISMGCTMAVRRKTALKYLKYSEQTIPHDWELAFLANIDDGLFFLNEKLIKYRIHSANTIGLKVQDDLIDSRYRVDEYKKYVLTYKYFLETYKRNIGKNEITFLESLIDFYNIRIFSIQNRKKYTGYLNAIKHFFSVGKTVVTVLKDY